MQTNTTEINETASKISNIFSGIKVLLSVPNTPTEEELAKMKDYCLTQESIGPLINPGAYHSGVGFDAISVLRKRIDILRELKEHLSETEMILAKKLAEDNE